MSRITTIKDKIPKKASWPGFLGSGKDSRTKVVLARKLEKQGLGSTPACSEEEAVLSCPTCKTAFMGRDFGMEAFIRELSGET